MLASAMAWFLGAHMPRDADLRALDLERMLSSGEDLRRAYRWAAKAAHPDAGGSADAFRAVSDAFRRLEGAAPWTA